MMVFFLIVLCAGCVPYSDHPLTDPDPETLDSTIFGTWYWTEGDETGYVHIGLHQDPGRLRVLMVELDRDGDLDISEFTGHTSLLNGKTYLNLQWVRPAHEVPGYLLVKYAVQGNSLGIALADPNLFEQAIQSGSLQGSLKNADRVSSVHIRAGQKQLQQFIVQHDPAIFEEMKYLHQLTLPDNRSRSSRTDRSPAHLGLSKVQLRKTSPSIRVVTW